MAALLKAVPAPWPRPGRCFALTPRCLTASLPRGPAAPPPPRYFATLLCTNPCNPPQAARGMEYLHGQFVVHFDLKCDNLLCDLRDPSRPTVKIGDLGLSKVRRRGGRRRGREEAGEEAGQEVGDGRREGGRGAGGASSGGVRAQACVCLPGRHIGVCAHCFCVAEEWGGRSEGDGAKGA